MAAFKVLETQVLDVHQCTDVLDDDLLTKQHTEQPEFNNEGEVDQNAKQCHDTCPLPATLTDNQTTELLNQSLESENIRLKKTVAQFQIFFKNGSTLYVIETINIELEHKVAKLLKENETLKKHYKELYDSIKTTRARNIEHKTSLIGKNDDFKAQLQEKGFAIAALKNELRKLTGNIGLGWVPTGKIFTSSTTKVDSESQNGLNDDITKSSMYARQTLDVSGGTLKYSAGTSLNPTKGRTPEDSHKDGDGDALFQLMSNSLPHSHAQTTMTYYKHQDSIIVKGQELRQRLSYTNSDIQDLP
ncbi:hypothetical protein Tco_0713688 [Tanacetum coccineum]